MDRKLAGVSVETYLRFVVSRVTVFAIFFILPYFSHSNSKPLKPKLVLLFYKHAYVTTKHLR